MSLSSVTPTTPTTSLYTGIYSDGAADSGTFARVIQRQDDSETVSTIRTDATGQTSTDQTTMTDNADGSITRDAVLTNAQGQTVQRDITLGAAQNGARSVTGTITTANGSVDQVTGSRITTSNGFNEALSLTNAAGQIASGTVAYAKTGSVDSTGVTGTNFLGAAISQQGSTTTLSSMLI